MQTPPQVVQTFVMHGRQENSSENLKNKYVGYMTSTGSKDEMERLREAIQKTVGMKRAHIQG
jgi:hypothetical protein